MAKLVIRISVTTAIAGKVILILMFRIFSVIIRIAMGITVNEGRN